MLIIKVGSPQTAVHDRQSVARLETEDWILETENWRLRTADCGLQTIKIYTTKYKNYT